ncbi:MAG: AI-2E family transporter [Clostridiales bacterium]|nr:AI-2E family transporter [Clostridiales bacterium]
MRLPWDRKYTKISFYVLITIAMAAILILLFVHIGEIAEFLAFGIGMLLYALSPLLIALFFAAIFAPVVDFFQRIYDKIRKKHTDEYGKRTAGTILLYLVVGIGLMFLFGFLANRLGNTDFQSIVESASKSIEDLSDLLVLFQIKLAEMGILKNFEGFVPNLSELIMTGATWLEFHIKNLANMITAASGWVLSLFISLALTFYILREKEILKKNAGEILCLFLPIKIGKQLIQAGKEASALFSGYITGQVLDAVIITVLISVTFSVIGIKFAFLIGIISGIANLVPYLGAFIAFFLSVVVGLMSGTPMKAIYAAIAVIVIQQIDGMFIVPKVVGKSVSLHPALVILALAVSGNLFGIIGMFFAVPVTALLRVYFIRFIDWQRKRRQMGMGKNNTCNSYEN